MAGIIISPLNAALYGTNFVVDDNKVNIYKPEPIDTDIQNQNVFYELLRLIDRELANRRDFESGNVLYDTIRSNVIACKMFASRAIGKCCITNKIYGEQDVNLKEHVFNGANETLGERWFFSAFPYHSSAEHLLPIAELMFNMGEYIVPLVDFPNIDKEQEYIVVNVKRSNGVMQRGIIKCNPNSMVIYRVHDGRTFTHPAYSAPNSPTVPHINLYFNSDYTDVDLENKCPITDCFKGVLLTDIIEHNPQLANAFRIDDEVIPSFNTAFRHSMTKY
jgi:hypothetical protein